MESMDRSMNTQAPKAVVLSSGGLDSTTVMAIAASDGYDVYSLSFDYGQRHSYELEAAAKIAEIMKVKSHVVAKIDLRVFGGSALTSDIPVPKNGIAGSEIPVTYVPARNTIFLSYALAWAEVLEANDIFIGVNAVDYSGYPDCRPDFIESFEKMANLATKSGVSGKTAIKIKTPLISLSKADIIRLGISFGIDYSITHSCYDPFPGGLACGQCDSCTLRKKGFNEAGITDPTRYYLSQNL